MTSFIFNGVLTTNLQTKVDTVFNFNSALTFSSFVHICWRIYFVSECGNIPLIQLMNKMRTILNENIWSSHNWRHFQQHIINNVFSLNNRFYGIRYTYPIGYAYTSLVDSHRYLFYRKWNKSFKMHVTSNGNWHINSKVQVHFEMRTLTSNLTVF